MKKTIIALIVLWCANVVAQGGGDVFPSVGKPPAELDLNPFYKKYVNANGIHIVGSHRVPDSAFHAAYRTIYAVTSCLRDDVLAELVKRGARVGIMARYEGTTDIPEHAYLENDTTEDWNWDVRARGLGGSLELPLNTCAEENLLCYQIDKYHAEDILIHEFAHTIHAVGINPLEPEFSDRLTEELEKAQEKGLWINTYAATNYWEYWAEGVQNWFNANAEVERPDGKHNWVNTKDDMQKYDPVLYAIVSRYFRPCTMVASCHDHGNRFVE